MYNINPRLYKCAYRLPLPCKKCKKDVTANQSWQTFRNGERHLRADCSICGSYLCYLPKTPANLASAPPLPKK